MDRWRYFEITHATHDLMNPSSGEQIEALGQAIGLGAGMRVLDLGCGHAEMLLRWQARFGITGVGVDASPYHAARASRRVAERGLSDRLEIIEGKGEDFRSAARFDVAACLGASWIFGGHAGTLRALAAFARPGGVVVTGEPYWKAPPPRAYLEAEGLRLEEFHNLGQCLELAREQGLELIWMARSSDGDWDRYEMRQAAALDAFARAHPEDPDLPELRATRRRADAAYARWGHACLGWALWAFRAPG